MTKKRKIKYVYIAESLLERSIITYDAYLGVVKPNSNNIKFFLAKRISDNKWQKYVSRPVVDIYPLSEFLFRSKNPYPYKIKKVYYSEKSFLKDHFEKLLAKV